MHADADATVARARSFLFVPASTPQRIPKALASGCHVVVIDLEDAVAAPDKEAAREALLRAWAALDEPSHRRCAIRINAPGTPAYAGDAALLEALASRPPAGVMVPKAESGEALARVRHLAPTAALLPLVESAEGLHAADALARAPGVARLCFGHLDFQADLGLACGVEETELDSVRLALVMASRRAGLAPPVDGVTTALDDGTRLAADARRSRRLGFTAKLCIHPRQVSVVNEALGPTPAQRRWAESVLAASQTVGGGAFRFEGQMVDAPVLARARALLA